MTKSFPLVPIESMGLKALEGLVTKPSAQSKPEVPFSPLSRLAFRTTEFGDVTLDFCRSFIVIKLDPLLESEV